MYKNNLLKEQLGNGESLFKYINPKERFCGKYNQIDECYCKINKWNLKSFFQRIHQR